LQPKTRSAIVLAARGTVAGFALMSLTSQALARPDTRTMTCAQAKTYVQQNKAIVMSTGQYTYTRIVSNQGSCSRGQTTRRLFAPTVDNAKCQVGLECRDIQFD
jgi:hypothetical protein